MSKEKVSFEDIFAKESDHWSKRSIGRRELKELSEKGSSEERSRLIREGKAKIAWLGEKATENVRSMLADENSRFSKYVKDVLTKHGRSVEDAWGICGFKAPIRPRVKKAKSVRVQIGSGVIAMRVPLELPPAVHIRVLNFWAEKLPVEKHEYSPDRPIGGYSSRCIRPQTIGMLAFKLLDRFSGTPVATDLRNPHVVIARYGSDGFVREPFASPPDPKLIEVLLYMAIPETALGLLFKEFGLPERAKEVESKVPA